MKLLCSCLLCVLLCTVSFSQTYFNVKINFPKGIDRQNLTVLLNTGKGGHKDIVTDTIHGTLQIADSIFGKYAIVYIYYGPEGHWFFDKGYFIRGTDNIIDIRFDTTTKKFDFNEVGSIVDQDGVGRLAFMQFTKTERDSLVNNNDDVQKIPSLASAYRAKMLSFVSQHPNLYLSLVIFRDRIQASDTVNGVSKDSLRNFYFKYLHEKNLHTYEDQYIQERFNYLMLAVNKTIPEFIYKDVKNKTVDLRKLKSKVVLMNFWASWCGPCVKEIPFFNELRKKYSSNFLEFAYISLDNSKDIENTASVKYKNTYGFHFLPSEDLLTQFNVGGILPVTFLIECSTGKILLLFKGIVNENDIENKLHELYKEN